MSTQFKARLDALALEGNKILLIAHSQGNLFVNGVFPDVNAEPGSVRVIHVAPPTGTLFGPFVTADIDIIIRNFAGTRLPNLLLSEILFDVRDFYRSVDWSGHGFIETYLGPGYARMSRLVGSALNGLVTPTAEAEVGFFTVTLTWNGSGDVDLHVFEPGGTRVNFRNRRGENGFLDVDNTRGFGPEHYFAYCDRSRLSLGTYRVGINNYSRATGRIATVHAASLATGELATRTLGVGAEVVDLVGLPTITVFNVEVRLDDNGDYVATVQ